MIQLIKNDRENLVAIKKSRDLIKSNYKAY